MQPKSPSGDQIGNPCQHYLLSTCYTADTTKDTTKDEEARTPVCERLHLLLLALKMEEGGHQPRSVTSYGDCSHEIKRRLLLGRKVMTNLDSIFKSRDITLPTKVRLVEAMVFPVVMHGCESWSMKKAES